MTPYLNGRGNLLMGNKTNNDTKYYYHLSEKYCWQNPNKALRICQQFCFASRFKTSCFEIRFLNILWRDITDAFRYLKINIFVEFFLYDFYIIKDDLLWPLLEKGRKR